MRDGRDGCVQQKHAIRRTKTKGSPESTNVPVLSRVVSLKFPKVGRQRVSVCHDDTTKGSSMERKRRTFSRDYKLAAVKKVVEQGLS